MIMRLARAIAPGLDAKAVAEELRLRVMEELDYEQAQSQRTFARAYRGHPFIYVPDVLTRLSRRRVLVTEYVEGLGSRTSGAYRRPTATGSARSSSDSASARSITCSNSTPIPTRATTS